MAMATELAFLENRLLDIAPDAMLVVDPAGRLAYANGLAEALFGYPPGALAGQSLASLIPQHLREQQTQRFADYIGHPHPHPVGAGPALSALRRDGSEFSAEISFNPLRTATGVFIVAIVRDVSEYGRIRQTLERTATELEAKLLTRNTELLQVNAKLRQQIAQRAQTEAALREAEAHYRQLVENQPDLICRFLPDTTLTFVNAAYARFFGQPPQDLIGKRFIDFLNPSERADVVEQLAAFAPERPERQYEHKTVRADGIARWHLWHDFALFDDSGKAEHFQSVGVDITSRKEAEASLFAEKERAQVTLHSIGDAVITTDAAAIVQYLNPVAEQLTGWPDDEARGQPLRDVFHIVNEQNREPAPDPVAFCLQNGATAGLDHHTVLISRDGKEYDIDDSAAPIRGQDERILGAVLVFHDIAATRQWARQMAHDASHDALTGLVNRAEFEKRLERAVSSARQYGARHAVCYLDLDQFKTVNDTAGHAAGDELLKQVNSLLSGMFRERDTLARIGGDEFGLLLDNCPLDRALTIAQTVVKTIRNYRFHWEGRSYQIGVSIGLVPINAQAGSTAELLTQADAACYTAKELGRNQVHVYQQADGEPASRHGEILGATGLQEALEQDRFRLYYQPIVALGEEGYRTVRHEVLLRVAHQDGLKKNSELVLPAAFIPVAERYGLMGAIDRWVIQAAFREHVVRSSQTGARLAINLSGTSLSDQALLDFIEAQFAKYGLAPAQVCFEITETAAIHNLRQATQLMVVLKRYGCQLALDDFGSGLSSFHYLKTLPVDFLKIDGSFIKDIINNPSDCALVAAINQMSHTLGLQTVAEYTHNQPIIERLRQLGVDYAQGYFFGKPAPWGQSR